MAVFRSNISDEAQERLPTGFTPFHVTVTVPTEALDSGDEQVLLYPFPESLEGGEVWLERLISNVDDLDSSATPALVYDVGVGDSDGVVDTSFVTGSTTGQAGGAEVIVDDGDVPTDVSGKFLILDVTTAAATAAEGDFEVFGSFAVGVNSKSALAEPV